MNDRRETSASTVLAVLTLATLTLLPGPNQAAVLKRPIQSEQPTGLAGTPSAHEHLLQQAEPLPQDSISGWLNGANGTAIPPRPNADQSERRVILPPPQPHRNISKKTTKPAARQCRQAAQFVLQAARARDAGMSPALFLATLERDLDTLLARPVSQRWFVRGPLEAGLIRFAAIAVFNRPASAEQHGRQFRRVCRQYQRHAVKGS